MTTRDDLFDKLDRLASTGTPAPCRTRPDLDWTSEHATAQRLAAEACGPCPAWQLCRAYSVGAGTDEWGTYAGASRTDRRQRTTSPKETAA